MNEKEKFEVIRANLCNLDFVMPGKMMSSDAIKFNDKVFAFLSKKGNMVFYIPDFDFGLAEFKCNQFNPFKKKAPMRNWVEVPFEENIFWEELANISLKIIRNK